MKSTTNYVCPVSGKSVRVPYSGDEEGSFGIYDGEDEVDLPLGWGRFVLDVVVANPEVAEVKRARKTELKEAMDSLKATAEDEAVPEAQRRTIQSEMDSGVALRQAIAMIEDRYPLPEEDTVLLRLQYPVLSDEAIGTLLKTLRDAGFQIDGPAQ